MKSKNPIIIGLALSFILAHLSFAVDNNTRVQQEGPNNIANAVQSGQYNYASIEQVGPNNSATIISNGFANGTAEDPIKIQQDGNDHAIIEQGTNAPVDCNKASVIQNGHGDSNWANVQQKSGNDNEAQIQVSGGNNGSQSQPISIIQTNGNFNKANIEIKGNLNNAQIYQNGNSNAGADESNTGSSHPPVSPFLGEDAFPKMEAFGAFITQNGNNNLAKQIQMGDNNYSYISQEGNNNTNLITQNGCNHKAAINQEGNNLVHTLEQNGNGLSYFINQTGATPDIRIIQNSH